MLNASGQGVPEAVVRLPTPDGFTFVFANDGGFFRFPDLALGDYLIQAPGPSKQGLIEFMIQKGMDVSAAFTACDIFPGCHDFPPGSDSAPTAGDLNSALAAYQNAVQTLFSIQDPQLTGVGTQQAGGFGWNKVRLRQDSTTVEADVRFLETGSVSGVTLDPNGAPTGAAVRLLALGLTGTGLPRFQELARVNTDPQTGEFSFSGIPRFDLATFQATGIRSGNFTLEAANPFTPARAQFSGQLNVNNPNMADIPLQFPPIVTNGDLQGIVFMPDGTTPAPENTEVAISFGDVVMQADADGRFQTQNQLLPGGLPYRLTATSPDGLKGEAWAHVRPGEVTEVGIRLLGLGNVQVNVVRPNGLPVSNADVTLKRGTFPDDTASGITSGGGEVQFFNITEGRFSVTAVEPGTGLKGVASDTALKGAVVEVTVTIKASGTVKGRFVSVGGQGIANAQISLTSIDGTQAFALTDAGGRFELLAIPTGKFTVEGNDPLTRVLGRTAGEVRFEGDLVEVTVVQLPRGTVEGAVLQGDGSTHVAGAPVTFQTSGVVATTIQATTRSDGGFRFEGIPAGSCTLRAIDPLSGFEGGARGSVSVEGEIVCENVLIEPFSSVHVQVLDSDGSQADNVNVTLSRIGFSRTEAVDANGEFMFERVPLGEYRLVARSLANERKVGEASVAISEASQTVDATVKLRGLGAVEVTVVAAGGGTVPSARVTLTAQGSFGSERPGLGSGTLPAFFTNLSGQVTIPGVPVGDFFVKAESGAVSGLVIGALAAPGDVFAVTVQLGGSGSVVGSVLLPNGSTPAFQAIVTLDFESQSGLHSGVLQVVTDLSGSFGTASDPLFTGIPIGEFTLSVFEVVSQGVQTVSGAIQSEGQVINLGALVLDNTAPFIQQIAPADGATGVSLDTDFVIEFSEPMQTSSLTLAQPNSNLLVKKGNTTVLGSLSFSNGDRTATFTSSKPQNAPHALESDTLYTVTILGVPKGPRDKAGLELLDPFVASFKTRDIVPPTASVSPKNGERQVLPDAVVRVTFSKAMANTFSLAVTDGGQPVGGQVSMTLGGTVAIFTPTDFLKANEVYNVALSNATDLAGNPLVNETFESQFFTVDTVQPVINALNFDGAPSLAEDTDVTIVPETPSADVARVEYLIDGQTPRVSRVSPFSLTLTLPVGRDSIGVEATAVDVVGNRSQPPTERVIPISDNAPPGVTLTNLSAVTEVTRGQSLSFEATATDDIGLSRIVFSTLGELARSATEDVPDGATEFTATFSFTVPNAARSSRTITVQAVAVDESNAESKPPAKLDLVVLDNMPPTVGINSPVNNAQVVPGPLNVVVAARDDVRLQSLTLACTPSAAGCEAQTIVFDPPTGSTLEIFTAVIPDLDAPATVRLTSTAVDTRGNSAFVTRTVQLADDVPPQIVSVTPPDGTTNVAASITVVAQASEPLRLATVNAGTVVLAQDGGAPVAAQVSLSADGLTITLDPLADLSRATLYRVTLTSEITDLAFNPLGSFTSEFTMGTALPPSIVSTPVTTATEGALYTYDVDATDPDFGDLATFSLDLAPAGMTIGANSGLIQWTPSGAQVGSHDVTVRATEAAGLFATQSFSIEVASLNVRPVANAGADQDAFVSELVTRDGSGSSDPDGTDIIFEWTFILAPEGSTATLSGADTVNPTFMPDVDGSYVIQLVVNDGLVDSTADTVVVTAIFRNSISLSPDPLALLTRDTSAMMAALGAPAGVGGQTINLVSAAPAVAQVPASVVVPEGAPTATFDVQTGIGGGTANVAASAAGFRGDSAAVIVALRNMTLTLDGLLVAVGKTSISASADGFRPASADFIVTSNVIVLGAPLTIAPGQTVSAPLTLNNPAPTGGVTVSLASSNESVATVTPSVFVPEGATSPTANPQVTGVGIGSTVITASADGFGPDTQDVTVTLTLSFSPSTLSVVQNSTRNITLNLSAAAPVGGFTVSLSVDDPAVATVAASVTVGEGQTLAFVAVTGVTPNVSTTLRANTPGVEEATATINVTPAPPINIGNATVGRNLQDSLTGSLGAAAPAGNVQVTITSADPSRLLLSTNQNTQGSDSITVQVGAGGTFISAFYLQALDEGGAVEITASAPGYATDTSTVSLVPSGFEFSQSTLGTTTFAANSPITVRARRLDPGTRNVSGPAQEVRGGLTVQITLTSSATNVGTLTSPLTINGGQSQANASFDPISAGETTLSLT